MFQIFQVHQLLLNLHIMLEFPIKEVLLECLFGKNLHQPRHTNTHNGNLGYMLIFLILKRGVKNSIRSGIQILRLMK
ncbi:MAG: hypothetical protein EBY07_08675 [Actinobacteria bacterium]|nr:hypothetical protein [Actinomycetota bacterium]